jgi:hypothetical protein
MYNCDTGHGTLGDEATISGQKQQTVGADFLGDTADLN